jgi:two-component system response regulator FixJ
VTEPAYVHIVDSDSSRRALIASRLYERSFHAEIYEDIEELVSQAPLRGALLVNGDDESFSVDTLIETLVSNESYIPVAFFSSDPSPQKIVRAMLSGALDYLQWPLSSDVLRDSIVRLTRLGEARAKVERRKAEARKLVENLTPRERDVLRGIVGGGSNKTIAGDLGISVRTVEIHRGNMMSRLSARSTSDAVRIGLYAGLGE